MFTPKEIDFLKKELNFSINQAQEKLDDPGVEGIARYQIEEKLITMVAVVNKLQHARPDKETKTKSARLLIVDDVSSMRNMHRQMMLEIGFREIDMAEDGLRAYSHLRRGVADGKPYDLVISDWEMPKVSGLELLRKVRTDKELWGTPFYLITSLSDKKHIVQGINTGATGYMVKPINLNIVKKKFQDYV
jgi:two-component system chemotaxis response regulator CheY